jgi:hypothetical protein
MQNPEEYAVIAAALRKRFRKREVKPSVLLETRPARNLPADPLSEFRDLQRRGFFRRMSDETFHDYVEKNRSASRLEREALAELSLLPVSEDGSDSANGVVRVTRVGFSDDQAFVTLEYHFKPGAEHEIGSFLFRRPARGTLRYKPGRAAWVSVETLFVLSGHPEEASPEPKA